jgi:hypothetical protein
MTPGSANPFSMIEQPFRAKASAIAKPMPSIEPVISADLSFMAG